MRVHSQFTPRVLLSHHRFAIELGQETLGRFDGTSDSAFRFIDSHRPQIYIHISLCSDVFRCLAIDFLFIALGRPEKFIKSFH
jgi:hypothetical protein